MSYTEHIYDFALLVHTPTIHPSIKLAPRAFYAF